MLRENAAAFFDLHSIGESTPDYPVDANLLHFGTAGQPHLDADPALTARQPLLNRQALYFIRLLKAEVMYQRQLRNGLRYMGRFIDRGSQLLQYIVHNGSPHSAK